jgi:hypothetical protein
MAANLEEITVNQPTGCSQHLALRLYNPKTHEWSLRGGNIDDGVLDPPLIGKFENGRGVFFDHEQFNGRTIMVRDVFSQITPKSHHFEQSFSVDEGKTWRRTGSCNVDTGERMRRSHIGAHALVSAVGLISHPAYSQTAPTALKRRHRAPASGATANTISISRLALENPRDASAAPANGLHNLGRNGRNIGRPKGLMGARTYCSSEADTPSGRFQGMSLRLYNPRSHQWSLNFSNSNDGLLAQPTVGEFKNGRGEFYDQESLNGRAILVRFVISDITANSARFVQSFSEDGGKTWEVNWIATDTRRQDEDDKAH